MRAIDIIRALSYMNIDMFGVIHYDNDSPLDESGDEFLDHYFGLGKPRMGTFTEGIWFYIYNEELRFPDYSERVREDRQAEPDVTLQAASGTNPGGGEDRTCVFLYKIDN